MDVVMGALNGIFLSDLHARGVEQCDFVRAAVAYAHGGHEFFDRCGQAEKRLQYYGLLDETGAVSVPVLDFFLKADGKFECRLVNGHFHSKVIWWHGFGAYIGSANLTHAAWFKNVECGIFLDEEELAAQGVGDQLDELFAYLQEKSMPISQETCDKLSRLAKQRHDARDAGQRLEQEFQKLFGSHLPHTGLTVIGKHVSPARVNFVKEWYETLQLLRTLAVRFDELGLRPNWVSPSTANLTVHFDQFLHAYYYAYVRGEDDEGKSVEKVERSYEKNRADRERALNEAATWWAALPTAPYGEDEFIANRAAEIETLLTPNSLRGMTQDTFCEAMGRIHAFRTHARQVKNKTLGLPPGHKEDMETRTRHLARWLWDQRTETGRTAREALEFVLYGQSPPEIEERLWLATHDAEWRLPHLGKSIIGEIIGWARPGDYPPRNNRTNKALRSLGYNVKLFSSL